MILFLFITFSLYITSGGSTHQNVDIMCVENVLNTTVISIKVLISTLKNTIVYSKMFIGIYLSYENRY